MTTATAVKNVRQPVCGDTVVYTPDGNEIDPAFVNNQSTPPPSPTTAPADILVFELDGTITPRVAVPFSATLAPNTWNWHHADKP